MSFEWGGRKRMNSVCEAREAREATLNSTWVWWGRKEWNTLHPDSTRNPLCRKLEALLMRAISARPPKIRVGVLGQCEGGGSEYLIRKIGARADFNKILIFLQNTLENVTERYLWARKTSFRSCCAWVKRFTTYDFAPRASTCDRKFENSI